MGDNKLDKNSFLINPDLLIWARKSLGLSEEESAKKLKVSSEVYGLWESGETAVPISKLKLLAKVFKRPSASFLLNKAPDEKLISEFRKLFKTRENASELTKPTLLAIRRAFRIQRILVDELDFSESPVLKQLKSYKNLPVDELVKRVKDTLSIDYNLYLKPKESFEQLNLWKQLVESLQVVVLEEGFPTEDARGFVVNHPIAPVIVLNTKDSTYGRIFTLLHEFCHILIGENSVDDDESLGLIADANNEIYCNSFSGNILAPTDFIINLVNSKCLNVLNNFTDSLDILSKNLNVSKDVVARRLLDLGYIEESLYKDFLRSKTIKPFNEKKTKMGNYYTNFIKNNGLTFISEVLNAYNSNRITYSETIEYLGVKPKTFEKLVPKVLTRL